MSLAIHCVVATAVRFSPRYDTLVLQSESDHHGSGQTIVRIGTIRRRRAPLQHIAENPSLSGEHLESAVVPRKYSDVKRRRKEVL